MIWLQNYLYNVMVATSQFLNVVFFGGDPDESISGRIGKSILSGGWASNVPWPNFMYFHWIGSIECDEGGNSVADRRERL
jgi:hypothetical protein